MAIEFKDRQSTYPNRYKITKSDGSAEYVNIERYDSPTVEGTPLNANTFNTMQESFSEKNHTHKASDINTGVFPTTMLPVIPMNKGGTGTTTGSLGLKNLLADGPMILAEGQQYGDELPDAGTFGRIFFVRVIE